MNSKVAMVHSVTINDTGDIKIDSSNIGTFQLKYYLIDAEILFSSSPFVEDKIDKFSYVRPFSEVNLQTKKDSRISVAKLSEDLQRKNMVIEVKSNHSQNFLKFFSSDLTVQIKEHIGEIKVSFKNDKKVQSSIYVKVYVKTKDGKELFFKDGYTDFMGIFQYSHASGLTRSSNLFEKFAIFISHPEYGSITKCAGADGQPMSNY